MKRKKYISFIALLLLVFSVYFFHDLSEKAPSVESNSQYIPVLGSGGHDNQSVTHTGLDSSIQKIMRSVNGVEINPFVSRSGSSGQIAQTVKTVQKLKEKIHMQLNSTWETQTIQLKDGRTVTYKFGEGNSKEVALTTEELKATYKRCGSKEDPDWQGEFCGEEAGYVSPEVEEHLLIALSDKNWPTLIKECSEQLKYSETFYEGHPEEKDILYRQLVTPDFLSPNNWIAIDLNTGRKSLNLAKIFALQSFFYKGTFFYWKLYNDDKPAPYKNAYCIDIYAREINRQLTIATEYYRRPPEVF